MNNPRISIPQGGFKGLAACGIIGKDVQKEAMYGVNLYSGALVQDSFVENEKFAINDHNME